MNLHVKVWASCLKTVISSMQSIHWTQTAHTAHCTVTSGHCEFPSSVTLEDSLGWTQVFWKPPIHLLTPCFFHRVVAWDLTVFHAISNTYCIQVITTPLCCYSTFNTMLAWYSASSERENVIIRHVIYSGASLQMFWICYSSNNLCCSHNILR